MASLTAKIHRVRIWLAQKTYIPYHTRFYTILGKHISVECVFSPYYNTDSLTSERLNVSNAQYAIRPVKNQCGATEWYDIEFLKGFVYYGSMLRRYFVIGNPPFFYRITGNHPITDSVFPRKADEEMQN